MEEILKKANELGLMIMGTDVYKRFDELRKRLEEDPDAMKLLDEYIKFSDEMQQKENSGTVIEVSDKQKLQEMSEKLSENQLIKEYIATQTYYMNLMLQIQKVINEPEGEPIAESKIIKPDQPGKIITDI